MSHLTKPHFFIQFAENLTQEISLPFPLLFLIEFWSNIQTFTLILFPIISVTFNSESRLSTVLNQLLSYLDPIKTLNPFQTKALAFFTLCLTLAYLVGYTLLILHVLLNTYLKKRIAKSVLQVSAFLGIIHSRLIFFVIHCFFVQAINLNTNCDTNSFICQAEWIAISPIILVLNLGLAVLKESICFTIHRTQDPFAVKNNIHSLIKLTQKMLIVLLSYLADSSQDAVVILNIVWSIAILAVLYRRLPYYNLSMLKLNILWASVNCFFALTSLARVFNYEKDILLFTALSVPLIVKISATRLSIILVNILEKPQRNRYHAVHLPILIEEFSKKAVMFSMEDEVNKATLYSMAFMTGHVEEFAGMKKSQIKEGVRAFAFDVAAKRMSDLLKSHPNDELLFISLVQIYLMELKDNFRSLSIMNTMKNKKLSIQGRISLEIISKSMEYMAVQNENNQDRDRQQIIHMEYFSYKNKSSTFKNLIKQEIAEHLQLWKMVQGGTIHTMNKINCAEIVHTKAREINRYWMRHFHSNQYKYINACLMYGFYLEVVQALPLGGAQLLKKAFTALSNKWHLNKDLVDIIKKKNAVIVASIMPETLGKIIETSASAKDLFKAPKQGLIGSNIAVMMPSFVAGRHNNFIRRYQKGHGHQLKSNFVTYAKTFSDDYFRAELILNLHPDTEHGLNVAVCVKKIGEFESILIVDEDGLVVDCSKAIVKALNIPPKKDQYALKSLCPALEKIDQAFNMVHRAGEKKVSMTVNEENNGVFSERSVGAKILTEKDTGLDHLMSSETIASPLVSPTGQRLLSQGLEKEDQIKSTSYRPTDTLDDPDSIKSLGRNKRSAKVFLQREEAEILCAAYKEPQRVYFNHYGKNQLMPGKNNSSQVPFQVEIEPMIVDGSLYKVIKVQDLKPAQDDRESEMMMVDIKSPDVIRKPSAKLSQQQQQEKEEENLDDNDDTIADNFPEEHERDNPIGRHRTTSIMKSIFSQQVDTKKEVVLTPEDSIKSSRRSHKQISEKMKNFSHHMVTSKSKKPVNKENSIMASSVSKKTTTKRFKDALKMTHHSPAVRLSILMVYLAVAIIIGSICAGHIYTTHSLENMKESINLISYVNLRLGKTLLTLQAMLVVYSRSVGLRPIDSKVPMYQTILVEKSLDMLANSKNIIEQVNKLENKQVARKFFAKTITFWEPLEHTIFDNGQIDTITALNILTDYNLYFGRYTGSVLDLNGDRKTLFSLNNTANDYFINLQATIDYVSDFFQETKDNNVKLMKIIMALEILFVMSPFILISALMYVTLQKHSKLSQVFTKIQDQSISHRVQQLESIAFHFEQALEDSIVEYNDGSRGYLGSSRGIDNKNQKRQNRRTYKLKGLVLYVLRYLLLAGLMVVLITIFLSVYLSTSISSLNGLEKLKSKIAVSFGVSNQVKMVLPAFYFELTTNSRPGFTIKYKSPVVEIMKSYYGLGNATRVFLETFVEDGEIDDPTVADILNGKVCNYVTDQYHNDCLVSTHGGEGGLFGLFSTYFQVANTITQYFQNPDKSFNTIKALLVPFGKAILNTHLVTYDACDALSIHLTRLFNHTVETDTKKSLTLFLVNLGIVILALFVLRIVVLTRLHSLNLGLKKIVDMLPYKMIVENKIISFYLVREMSSELANMNNFGGH